MVEEPDEDLVGTLRTLELERLELLRTLEDREGLLLLLTPDDLLEPELLLLIPDDLFELLLTPEYLLLLFVEVDLDAELLVVVPRFIMATPLLEALTALPRCILEDLVLPFLIFSLSLLGSLVVDARLG